MTFDISSCPPDNGMCQSCEQVLNYYTHALMAYKMGNLVPHQGLLDSLERFGFKEHDNEPALIYKYKWCDHFRYSFNFPSFQVINFNCKPCYFGIKKLINTLPMNQQKAKELFDALPMMI